MEDLGVAHCSLDLQAYEEGIEPRRIPQKRFQSKIGGCKTEGDQSLEGCLRLFGTDGGSQSRIAPRRYRIRRLPMHRTVAGSRRGTSQHRALTRYGGVATGMHRA